MSALAGINKMGYGTIDMLLPDVITPKPVQDWIDRSKANADDINERVNRYNYERGGAAGAFLGSAFQSAIQMVPQAVLAVLSGGTSETAQAATAIGNVGKSAVRKVIEAMGKNPSYWTSFAQTVGSDYEDAKAGGASDTQAAVSAILSSAVNAGIEVGGGLETLADNPNTIRQWLKSAGEEGAEEVKQGIVTGLAQKGVYDHGKPWLTAGSGEGVVDPVRAAQEYGAGALVGGVVGAPRMLGGVRGQAQTETQTRTSVSPEAEQNYRQQIDGVFDGSLPSNRLIDLGNTPEVLRALGANNIPLRMTQEVARKIAYPENYLGGKHNLGISALKNLLPQINDPLAVLRSNTQGNSLVLLTQWNDANNNPVIAAVHLNKQGIADDVNVVASAYGKRNIDALLGENGQNIIYTKENKSINQLLDNRLQLPELVADDTLVDYSIRRDAGNSNGSAENSANIMQNTPEGALELLTQTLVKLDAELRAAQQLPPGAVQEQAVAAVQEQIRRTVQAYSIGQMDKRNHPSSTGSSSAPFGRGAQNTRMVSENSIAPDGANGNTSAQNTFGFTPEQIARPEQQLYTDRNNFRTYGIINEMSLTPLTEAPSNYQGSPSETDSFTDNSIRQNAGNSNTLSENVPLSEYMQYGKTPEQAAMEAKAKREGMAKRAARELYRNVVSGQAEMERFAQMQKQADPDRADANDLAQMNRVAGSTVDTIAEKALVDRKGDAIGKGWLETVGGLSREQLEELNLYRLHEHNIDRMSLRERTESARAEAKKDYEAFLRENPKFLTMTESRMRYLEHKGTPREQSLIREYHDLKNELDHWEQIKDKPVLAKKDPNKTQDIAYTAKESERILREMEERNPMLPQWAAETETFHDKFMREWAIGSGLMSEAQYEMLKERYPHYVQTYRVRDQWGGGTDTTRRGSVNTGSPIKDAVGDITKIVPFEDAEMMQVNSIVKNARRNELFRNIYEFTEAHPKEAANYVRIVSKDADADAAPITSFDDLTGDMADAAMSDQGGIYTIRAMVDGKPITMQVNSAFYAGLQNLFGQDRGASDSFMKKTFGTMTNAFKLFTTGKNPLFFLTNLPKDFQTAYINTTSSRKTLLTWLYDVGQTVKHMAKNDADWQAFQALGGAGGGYYHNEKGFTRSAADAGKHSVIKKIWAPIDAISENTEALWRFNEYRAAVQRYGDTEAGRAKAIQAAADVTTNFSRTAPATKAAENYCAYLNASVQGLDKIARQVKEHPILTARRAAEIIALPTLLLYLINRDDDNYKNLNNRTKDNYYCIPIGGGDFLKIPKSREYGVAMGALLERFFRLGEGEEADSAFKGIGEQFMTNLAPSNPVTDNILKTVFIDLPTNRDFAGRSIVPERMEGLSPENQYDYTTSGAGMALAKGWNATLGRALGKVSPMQVDYLIDSNLGFVGDAIIGATTDPKSPGELAKSLAEHPVKTVLLPVFNTVKQKFTANPLYQNGVTDAFYDELDAAKRAANDKNLVENLDADIVTPEEKYYSALNKSSGEISDLRKQERAILADKSLDDEEREKQVREIRQQILDIAKGAKAKAQAERAEYEKTYVPELSPLSEARQADGREAMRHGVTAQQFAQWDGRLKELTNEKGGDGKKVRSEAVARRETLQEVLDDKTLSDSEKQAVADYVLISTMGDSEREDWETTVKGKVNAIDYVRFRSDVAEYKKEYKGTGADNVANVTAILRGYEGLTDEQRDVLMSTYTGAAKNNTYHESTYEKKLKDNSLYQNMSDGERSKVRSYCNEYEQAVSEGKELDGWKAKAYMAKEAGIAPETYALFYTALSAINEDGGTAKNEEITQAVKLVPGLTDHQRAYLWQAAYGKDTTKNNPWGGATVTKYQKGENEAVNPVEGGTISSGFGWRQSFQTSGGASSSNHRAIDIAAPQGTPVKAAMSGKIVGMNKYGYGKDEYEGYGVSVTVDCGNGITMAYHHMVDGSNANLNIGDEVKVGQQIGQVGSTGKSTGPHLDFQVVKDGKYVDPRNYIPGYGEGTSETISAAQAAVAASSGKKSGKSHKSGGSGKSGGGMKTLDTMDTLRSLW